MRIVVAMDAFKGSLTADAACRAVARGLVAQRPGLTVVQRPMADGGEGTAGVLVNALGGTWATRGVTGPLPGMRVEAAYGWLDRAGPAAIVEMAAASGLPLLAPSRRDPLRTTSKGTGELLAAAADRGPRRVWLAIGGSATVDGGVGAAAALGWRFLARDGRPVDPGGAGLERITRIVAPDPAPALPPLEVLCDVDNPLLGPRGAAAVFGPQKGASPTDVRRLEAGLARLADLVETQLGRDVRELPGAGAAGGLGAGAVAFLGARLVSGVERVAEAVGLSAAAAGAAWVITGEGRFDVQSLGGKVVSGVRRIAHEAGARVAVIAGSSDLPAAERAAHGIHALEVAAPRGMPLEEAMDAAPELLEAAGRRLATKIDERGPEMPEP